MNGACHHVLSEQELGRATARRFCGTDERAYEFIGHDRSNRICINALIGEERTRIFKVINPRRFNSRSRQNRLPSCAMMAASCSSCRAFSALDPERNGL
jgi:hypothetical protein